MTYKHLTIDELTMIESYYLQHNKQVEIANRMGRAIQTIYNVVNMFNQCKSALDYCH
ncbi:helix-turn-helix domain-containing protein, partial [Enterococcus faecium]